MLQLIAPIEKAARGDGIACSAIAFACLSAEQLQEAIKWFDRAIRLQPQRAENHAGKGLAQQSLGNLKLAIRCYDTALGLRPIDPETHYNKGSALMAMGELDAALLAYGAALAQRPSYELALLHRASALHSLGRFAEALASLDAALAVVPGTVDFLGLRGNILLELERTHEAVACYDQVLDRQPQDFAALVGRANALKALKRYEAALQDTEAALAVMPGHAETLVLRGDLLKDLDRTEDALTSYRRALAISPLLKRPSKTSTPRFRALLLFAPLAGNTPYDDLICQADFDCYIALVVPGFDHDPRSLRRHADVVVNLVSDTDLSAQTLPRIGKLLAELRLPAVNNADLISRTARDEISRALAGIAGCIAPPTRRFPGRELLQAGSDVSIETSFPAVIRPAGTHGGERMACVANEAELRGYIATDEEACYYIAPFIDYRSPDGYFRKYRFIFVGDQVLPYHLAIGSHWKVHHASTDMGQHAWMQQEEQSFLEDPWAHFGEQAQAALHEIRKRIGIDYFGIDCALDNAGRLVVFEANATMLVHQRNDAFPYKNSAVLRIKEAFAALLAQAARRH